MNVGARSLALSALVATVLLGSACSPAPARPPTGFGGSATPAMGQERVSAILVQPVHDAQVVHGSDGSDHVEYELMIVNAFGAPVTLTAVTVLDSHGTELTRLDGPRLEAATQTLYTHVPSAVIAPSAAVALELDVTLAAGQVPERMTHRIEYAIPEGAPGAAMIDATVVHGPQVAVDRREPVIITAPLSGDGWLATSACCTPNVHRDLRLAADGRRLTTAETFAVDWALVRGDRLYDGVGSTNEQFYGFGAPVLAVATGTVVAIRDGIPDSMPFLTSAAVAREDFGGNQVILQISPGVYAVYGHLRPGSLTVQVGDMVRSGQVLAALGNSGPSQGPHLHFGLLDAPDLFLGRSLPFALADLTLTGTVDFAASPGDELAITGDLRSVPKSYPLHGTIVDFR